MSAKTVQRLSDVSISLAKHILEYRKLNSEFTKKNTIDIINDWSSHTGIIISDIELMQWTLEYANTLCQTPISVLSESVRMDEM